MGDQYRPSGATTTNWVASTGLAIAYAATAVLPLYVASASAGAIQARVGIDTSEFGYAISCYFAAGALVSHRVGPMVDRIPLPRALTIGMASSAAASAMLAFVADTWGLFAFGLALCGVAHAFTQLGTNRILAGQRRSRRALGFGLKQASIPVASLLAGFATAALAPPASPTPLFVGAALLAIAFGAIAPRLVGPLAPASAGAPTRGTKRPLYRLAIAAGLAAAAGNTLSVLVVDSFTQQGFSSQTGALVLALGSAAAVLVRISTGWVIDRRHSDGRRELQAMLFAGAASFALLGLSSGSTAASTAVAVLAFGTGWGWPGVVFFVASTQRDIPPATGSGLILSGTMSGSILGPVAIATLADHFGYGLGWSLGAAQLALAAILIRRTTNQAWKTAEPGDRRSTEYPQT